MEWKKLKRVYWALASMVIVILLSTGCSNRNDVNPERTQTPAPAELNIWWEQGLNLDEDEAIRRIIKDWQQQTGNKVNLSLYSNNTLTNKAARAVRAGHPPDILMTPKAERILYSRLAWEGKLVNVSDVIEPVANRYPKHILQGITYYNAQKKERGYYGVPIHQTTMGIYYWQNLLADIGLTAEDIPQDWSGFWQFWQQAQTKLAQKNRNIYGLGLTLADNEGTDDTHYLFEQILEAYDISILDHEGNLKLDSQVRQEIRARLAWYANLYQQGFIPPDAVEWTNTDNNRSLLNQSVLMTPNVSLSIPTTIRQDKETYRDRLGMVEFPAKPNGLPMRYLIFIRQAIIFQDSPHQSLAKDFLRYFIQPQISVQYLKATGSRNQPVQNSVWSDPYWQNTQDPYIATITKILRGKHTRLSYIVDNPAYSQVLAENIWGKALTKVTANKIDPEQAADEAIARIKAIFAQWHDSVSMPE